MTRVSPTCREGSVVLAPKDDAAPKILAPRRSHRGRFGDFGSHDFPGIPRDVSRSSQSSRPERLRKTHAGARKERRGTASSSRITTSRGSLANRLPHPLASPLLHVLGPAVSVRRCGACRACCAPLARFCPLSARPPTRCGASSSFGRVAAAGRTPAARRGGRSSG